MNNVAISETLEKRGSTEWFVQERFGMFIHWGLYAMPARHEWVKKRELIPEDKYNIYFKHFDPDMFDPQQWAKIAAEAGMKYVVITTKHHEGFCLWDSQLTDYKATNTPAGKDLLREIIDAFRLEGIRIGLYHSLIDWNHPDFRIDDLHPLKGLQSNDRRVQEKYTDYLHGQVRELLTMYGKIDILWFDYSYPAGRRYFDDDYDGKGKNDWRSEALLELVRELAPEIILNDRLDLDGGWDVKTPEQITPENGVIIDGKPVVWEACQTLSGSWGYHRDESSWRDADDLLRSLITCVSGDGNLLLNVGPTSRGYIDERAIDRLKGMSKWMKYHERSIRGCTRAPDNFIPPKHCAYTWNPANKRLYLHIFAWPHGKLFLNGLEERFEYAQFLYDGSEVINVKLQPKVKDYLEKQSFYPKNALCLALPLSRPPVIIPVIEIFLK